MSRLGRGFPIQPRLIRPAAAVVEESSPTLIRAQTDYYITTLGASQVIPIPTDINGALPQVGDPVGIWITGNDNTLTLPSGPTGWTVEYATSVGTGFRAFLHKLYDDGTNGQNDGSSVTVVFSKQPTMSVAIIVFDQRLHLDFGPIGTVTQRPSGVVTTAAATGSSVNTPNLVVFHEKTTSQTTCTVSGATVIVNRLPPSGVAGSLYVGYYDTSGGTTDVTATYALTGNTNGVGYQVPLISVSAGPPVTAVTDWFLSPNPGYIARGAGSNDWPEYTMYAYSRSASWYSQLALEMSVWKTTDGVWVCSHDQTTGADYGTNLTITSSTWSDLSALRTTVGNQPMAKMTDVLDLYATDERVIFLDNKGQTTSSALLDLLEPYGGANRFIAKGFCTSTTWADAASARDYLCWGYYYDADVATNLPATASHWNILGMDYTASSTDWTTILSYSKPVIGHIIPDLAAATTAFGLGAFAVMCSGVVEAVPADAEYAGVSF